MRDNESFIRAVHNTTLSKNAVYWLKNHKLMSTAMNATEHDGILEFCVRTKDKTLFEHHIVRLSNGSWTSNKLSYKAVRL